MIFLFSLLSFFAAGVLAALAAHLESKRYEITPHEVRLGKPLLFPVKILHLSDIHFAKANKPLGRFFERLMRDSYDFIFITGDIFDSEKGIPACLECLEKLKAQSGVFAVFGNHDYYDYRLADVFTHNFPHQKRPKHTQPVARFEEALAKAGVRLLKNETVETEIAGTRVLIHALDDPTTGRANVRKTMQHFDESKINILLTHTIDVFLDIGENEIDLSFSGHSHGGQIRLPGIGPLVTHTMLGTAYASGLKSLQGAVCSISRGLGTSRFVPFRLFCPPEAIVLTVRGEKKSK